MLQIKFVLLYLVVNCASMPHLEVGQESQNQTTEVIVDVYNGTVEPPKPSPTPITTKTTVPSESGTVTLPPDGENLVNSIPFPTSPTPPLPPSDENNSTLNSTTTTTVIPEIGKGEASAASTTSTTFSAQITGSDPSVILVAPGVPPEGAGSTAATLTNLQDIPITLVSLAGNSGGFSLESVPTADSLNLDGQRERETIDFTKMRYHVETGQLIKIGNLSVCPPNMRFFAVPGHPKNGACDCDYYQCSRPLIYSPQKHQCYWAWSQGPCEKGEWFVFDTDLRKRGKCAKNPCPPESPVNNHNKTLQYFFQNPIDETCYEAGTQGYCTEDERLLMYPGEPIPECRSFTFCYPLTVPEELKCVFGNKYFVESGQC